MMMTNPQQKNNQHTMRQTQYATLIAKQRRDATIGDTYSSTASGRKFRRMLASVEDPNKSTPDTARTENSTVQILNALLITIDIRRSVNRSKLLACIWHYASLACHTYPGSIHQRHAPLEVNCNDTQNSW